MPGVADLNALPARDFEELLLRCCAAPGWALEVTEGRPYASLADLLAAADAAWAARGTGDLDAAMSGHPRIGERRLSGWSAQEQPASARTRRRSRRLPTATPPTSGASGTCS